MAAMAERATSACSLDGTPHTTITLHAGVLPKTRRPAHALTFFLPRACIPWG